MDFKVTGTERWDLRCAQMDIKVDGLPMEVMRQALERGSQRSFAYSGCNVSMHAGTKKRSETSCAKNDKDVY